MPDYFHVDYITKWWPGEMVLCTHTVRLVKRAGSYPVMNCRPAVQGPVAGLFK